MKYTQTFESFVNESTKTELTSVNENKYAKAGKLGYNDQFLNRKMSLAKTLSTELGLTKEFTGPFLGFDHVSLFAIGPDNVGGTIIDDALTGKYTYDDLKAAAIEYLKDKNVDIKE